MLDRLKKVYDFFLISKTAFKTKIVRIKEKSCYKKLLGSIEGNDLIYRKILANEPTAIGKIGTTELSCLRIYKGYFRDKSYSSPWDIMRSPGGRYYGGIYPDTPEIFEQFSKIYIESLKTLDMVGAWYNKDESKIINEYCNSAIVIDSMRFIEPYYFSNPWSKGLRDKVVLVIHPFEESILYQYDNRKLLWENPGILPDFTLKILKVPQNAGVQKPLFENWVLTLQYLKDRVDNINFDVAIIGCGAWSIPLVSHIKEMGKIGIHMGGATQILFGIKGGRWLSLPSVSKFFNEHWINVLESDLPDMTEVRKIPKIDQYW